MRLDYHSENKIGVFIFFNVTIEESACNVTEFIEN